MSNSPLIPDINTVNPTSAMANAQAQDAASNWWVKPVMGIAGAGLSAVEGGLGSMAEGGSFGEGAGASLRGA
jgi:hypothetical protein